jgi:small subunit ribosomal protein S17
MKKRGLRKKRIGIVLSNKMDKTAVVQVERLVKHAFYKKYIRRRVKYICHDEQNRCQVGDKVIIIETRPLSRMKRWRVSEILEKVV